MRIANLAGRAVLVVDDSAVDIAEASKNRFGPTPREVFDQWEEFSAWASQASPTPDQGRPFEATRLGAPSDAPRQVFAIGLNYRAHAEEAGAAAPAGPGVPPTFTKFDGALTGPYTEITLPSDTVDWEAELVVVIGKEAKDVPASDAWDHVAGLTVGQDFSERTVQRHGPVPQFSLAKSYPGFGPTGPWLVSPDEFADPNDLKLECVINGETVQKARTSSLLLPVADLIERISAVCALWPGDLIFTGTPAGVGMSRTPEKYLKVGDEVVSRIEGIGEIRQTCVG